MGKFIIDDEEFDNHFVDSGKQLMLDGILGGTPWVSSNSLYVGIGQSTDTNAGVTGPVSGTNLSITGAWQGVENTDWKLSDEITGAGYRPQAVVERVGNTVYISVDITDDNVTYPSGVTEIEIYEMGIFVTGAYGPAADPTSNVTYRDQAMIIRSVTVKTDSSEFIANPIIKYKGVDRPIKYVFADFEG